MKIECAVCGKELTRFNAVRIGGIIGQLTGKRFMCADCVKLAHSGKIKYEVKAV